MQKAKALLDDAQLNAAIESVSSHLKERPEDESARMFLFELLSYAGELDRAERQVKVLSGNEDDPTKTLTGTHYRQLLEAERQRTALFLEGRRPQFALEPTAAVTLHLEAIDHLRNGQPEQARALLDQASEVRRATPGNTPGGSFEDIQDADDLLGPVLEVFVPSGYCWIPWEHLQFLEVEPPQDFRDLLWGPAKLATFDGQLGRVHVPLVYPASSQHPDDLIRLGRRTDWLNTPGEIVRGVGCKEFVVDDQTQTLLELRELKFAPPTT